MLYANLVTYMDQEGPRLPGIPEGDQPLRYRTDLKGADQQAFIKDL